MSTIPNKASELPLNHGPHPTHSPLITRFRAENTLVAMSIFDRQMPRISGMVITFVRKRAIHTISQPSLDLAPLNLKANHKKALSSSPRHTFSFLRRWAPFECSLLNIMGGPSCTGVWRSFCLQLLLSLQANDGDGLRRGSFGETAGTVNTEVVCKEHGAIWPVDRCVR